MNKFQKFVSAVVLTSMTAPLLFSGLYADTNQVPIPNGNQSINVNTTTPVDAIVTDSQGNMSEQQVPYNPQTQSVTINNNYGGDNASVFLPMFSMGFMFFAGYWVGHNGSYWNGSNYVHVTNVNWNQHWNNYWHHTWAPKWNNYYHQHYNDPGFKYHNHGTDWHDNAGQWHNNRDGDHGNMNRGNMDRGGMDHGGRGGGDFRGGGRGGGGGGHR